MAADDATVRRTAAGLAACDATCTAMDGLAAKDATCKAGKPDKRLADCDAARTPSRCKRPWRPMPSSLTALATSERGAHASAETPTIVTAKSVIAAARILSKLQRRDAGVGAAIGVLEPSIKLLTPRRPPCMRVVIYSESVDNIRVSHQQRQTCTSYVVATQLSTGLGKEKATTTHNNRSMNEQEHVTLC